MYKCYSYDIVRGNVGDNIEFYLCIFFDLW